MPPSRQQKCGLAFAAVCCLIFGGAIATCGFLFQYLEPYDTGEINGKSYASERTYEYYYTQYWLGIPLVVVGLFLLPTICCKGKCMLIFCIMLSTLTLILSIAAVVLEGPKWRQWISIRRYVVHNNKQEIGGVCVISGGWQNTLSCREIYYVTLMQSVIVACSILGIVVSQFIIFLCFRALDWLIRGSYNVAKNEGNSKVHLGYNSGGNSNPIILSHM